MQKKKIASRFKISRDNGLSDSEVIVDFVGKQTPGQIVTYKDFASALESGSAKKYPVKAVQSAVCRAERKIAVNLSRSLLNVPNVGYKVALASEHQKIAGRKRERSEKLLQRGLMTLQHVKWEEMDENQRRAHEGQLLISSALYNAMTGFDRRLAKIESAIKNSDKK